MSADSYESLAKVAGPVSRETYLSLRAFVDEVLRWNKVTNLVAHSTTEDIWRRHILDSAQLNPLAPDVEKWLDLGSGGGFPGLVIGFLVKERRNATVHLVESNRKKAGFLRAVVGSFDLPIEIHACRIEDAYSRIGPSEVVSARALASLPKLLTLAERWLAAGAAGLFHKGREFRREIEESSHAWKFDLIEHASAVESQGVVLEIRNLTRV